MQILAGQRLLTAAASVEELIQAAVQLANDSFKKPKPNKAAKLEKLLRMPKFADSMKVLAKSCTNEKALMRMAYHLASPVMDDYIMPERFRKWKFHMLVRQPFKGEELSWNASWLSFEISWVFDGASLRESTVNRGMRPALNLDGYKQAVARSNEIWERLKKGVRPR